MNSYDGRETSSNIAVPVRVKVQAGLIGSLVGVIVSVVLLVLSVLSMAAGHGSGFPYVVFIFPLLYGLLVWPLVGLALGVRSHSAALFAASALVVYLAAVLYHAFFTYRDLLHSGAEGEINLFTVLAVAVWAAATGQAWRLVFRRVRQ